MCKVAGLCSLLSSEVSAVIVCLITLDRFLVQPVSLPERLGPPGLRSDVGPGASSGHGSLAARHCPLELLRPIGHLHPAARHPADVPRRRLLLRRHDRLQLPPLPAHRRGAGLHLLVSQRRQHGGQRQQQALQGPDHRPPAHYRGRVGLPLLVPHRPTRHPGLQRYPGPWRGQCVRVGLPLLVPHRPTGPPGLQR